MESNMKQLVVVTVPKGPEYIPEKAGERVQRMIFVASTYFHLIGVKNPSREELNDVNSMFHLVHDQKALKLPAAISKLIWGSTDLQEVCFRLRMGTLSMSAAVLEVMPKIPRWMRYGDGTALKEDLKTIFECCVRR